VRHVVLFSRKQHKTGWRYQRATRGRGFGVMDRE
jgi:hypothetical protein